MIDLRGTALTALATGRHESLFSEDLEARRQQLAEQITGRRVLLIGGAGSIGSATVRALIPFGPRALHVVDQSENSLVELVRDIRSTFEPEKLLDFRTLPLNFGSPVMQRFLSDQEPYECVLNFAALKHVRSEKDCYSILQMMDTNVIRPLCLLRWLASRGGLRRYFCVSTDKAANPVNLMGASKRLMEHVIFSSTITPAQNLTVTSSRFANVAFSDGSLPQGWLMRLAKRQPVAVPRDAQRYFVSLEEAGQICLLAAFLAPDRHLFVPRLDPARDQLHLSKLAERVLAHFGYAAKYFEDKTAACRAATSVGQTGYYPLLLTPLDTSGEKAYEEFVGIGEQSIDSGLQQLLAVRYLPCQPGALSIFLQWLEEAINSPQAALPQQELVAEIQKVLPDFHHCSSPKSLDQRL